MAFLASIGLPRSFTVTLPVRVSEPTLLRLISTACFSGGGGLPLNTLHPANGKQQKMIVKGSHFIAKYPQCLGD